MEGAASEESGQKGRQTGRRQAIGWIYRRRPILTAFVVLAALAHALLTRYAPADLLDPSTSWRFWVPWLLMISGAAVRLWGSGNLRKNQEITSAGVYALIRHPLYLGSLSSFLAYFLSVGNPAIGLAYFAILLIVIYYPTMLAEEEYLRTSFPAQHARQRHPPRLLPDLSRIGEAVSTDRFRTGAAYRNLGFRSLWFLVGLPLFLRLLAMLQRIITP